MVHKWFRRSQLRDGLANLNIKVRGDGGALPAISYGIREATARWCINCSAFRRGCDEKTIANPERMQNPNDEQANT